MATHSCLFPQHCLSMEPLVWAPRPHWQCPATHCPRLELLFKRAACEGIASAEERLSLQSLGYFWSLLLVLFNTLSSYSVSGNTELLKKHSKQCMITACSAVLLKGAESNLYLPHYSSNIAETGRKGFNFFP